MDNNNKIITEELKQIVVLMNYDRSKTLMEQSMGGQSMSPGGTAPFTSNKSYGKSKPKEKTEAEQLEDEMSLYITNKEPQEPRYKNGKYYLPYKSERAVIKLCGKVKSCNCTSTTIYCSSDKYLDEIYEMDWNDWSSFYGPKAENRGTHETLGYVEMGLIGLGFIAAIAAAPFTAGGSVAVALGGLSTAALLTAGGVALVDTALYVEERDYYSAGMAGALALIPGDEFFKVIRMFKGLGKYELKVLQGVAGAPDDMVKIIKTAKKEGLEKLSKADLEKYLIFRKASIKNASLLSKETLKYSVLKAKTMLLKLPLGKQLYALAKLSKGLGLAVGLTYTFDQIWLAYSVGKSLGEEKRSRMRNFIAELPDGTSKQMGSDYGAIMDMAYDEGIGEVLKLMGKGLWSLVWNEDGTENKNGIDKIKDAVKKSIDKIPNTEEGGELIASYSKGPTEAEKIDLDKLGSSLKDTISFRSGHNITVKMLRNGTGTIQRGDKGNSTKYIQTLLNKIKTKDDENKVYLSDNPDADFGDDTEYAVMDFQSDYLDEKGFDGIVGKNTIAKMEEILKKQENEE
jgi:hypothetical protein